MIEEEQSLKKLRQGVREVCERFPNEYWRELDAKREYPEEFVRAMTEAGYLAALIPEEYGGMGLNLLASCAILEEANRSGANANPAHAQMYVMGTLLRHGSREQKREYLPKIASGELRLQAFGVTEPQAGTDTTRISTLAERRGDKYVVNGRKIYISRVQYSDLMILLARTTPLEEVEKRSHGLSAFILDLRGLLGKNLRVKRRRVMMNNFTNELEFKNVEVPAKNLIGEEGEGFRYIMDGMNAERILIAAECIGDGRFFIERATERANEREVFGRRIGQNQGIQFPIAQTYARVEAANLMVQKAAGLFDRGEKCGPEANMAKLLAADASWEAANVAMQTFGGYGVDAEYDIERKFRETRLYQLAPIPTNLILSYIAEHVLGLPRSF
ncbi:MAG: Acyl-CoA dehydrogenase [uncultured Rubrobacteraceae bacterium]|uniref:Acyl-CoA dehydrogenase n=1 Tax=uncultured Rubrobacteraceae bacterium TaxID=349277 RepID=A0A6J4QA10_9ACTN|nr:MAG: Acyl-CoA dehydrogenase [uncultured Rubrobacteraceae bacterium]